MNNKVVIINDHTVNFKIDKTTAKHFKNEFKKNILRDLNKIDTESPKGLEKAINITLPRLLWAMAKSGDSGIEKFEKWQQKIGDFNVLEVCDLLEPLLRKVGSHHD